MHVLPPMHPRGSAGPQEGAEAAPPGQHHDGAPHAGLGSQDVPRAALRSVKHEAQGGGAHQGLRRAGVHAADRQAGNPLRSAPPVRSARAGAHGDCSHALWPAPRPSAGPPRHDAPAGCGPRRAPRNLLEPPKRYGWDLVAAGLTHARQGTPGGRPRRSHPTRPALSWPDAGAGMHGGNSFVPGRTRRSLCGPPKPPANPRDEDGWRPSGNQGRSRVPSLRLAAHRRPRCHTTYLWARRPFWTSAEDSTDFMTDTLVEVTFVDDEAVAIVAP
mmetsp:Transcript_18791/g.49654  ORF Transcript_18791/g.49654 Transcript_18791/m.49654 type:complete len:272 (-) Transcript_18791:415-1230(-)